jgi:hypothetical protein
MSWRAGSIGEHGHWLQNRFSSIVVAEQAYLLPLVGYLHLNPLGAAVAVLPEKTYPLIAQIAARNISSIRILTLCF